MNSVTHVILCGGAGTRLWPLSNSKQPKQLLRLFKGKSLLQLASEINIPFANKVIAVTSAVFAKEVAAQLEEINDEKSLSIIAEPAARNTAAAIAIAALIADQHDVLLVTPSDHLLGTPSHYKKAILEAIEFAKDNALVTFGLAPLYPETGYGYIQYSGNDVIRFCEKPSLPLAESFIASGDYLWNSGIFCFKAGIILSELRLYAPEIYDAAVVAAQEWKETGSISTDTMKAIPSNSIDYAVMEKSGRVKVIPTAVEWSDVGSFEALSQALLDRYEHQNEKAVYLNSNESRNIVIGDDKVVAMVGVEDLVVVNTPQALLVMKKGNGQSIKQLHEWVRDNRPDLI